MSGFTPGPYVLRHSRISWWIEAPTDQSRQLAGGAIPADVWNREKSERDNCEALANGRLFAASDLAHDMSRWIVDNAFKPGPGYAAFEAEIHRRATAYLAKVEVAVAMSGFDRTLRVSWRDEVGQAKIYNAFDPPYEIYNAEYVSISGFFGPHKPETFAAAPELLSELDCRVGDLVMLRKAIEAGDPKRELFVRIDDMLRESRKIIAAATGEGA